MSQSYVQKSSRIQSIDILRGLVMIIMVLDHSRDYYHYGAFSGNPEDLGTTTYALFFTRFITHFCAPIFIGLAGTAAFLYGSKRTKSELSRFLLTRGVFLILLELIVMNLLWWFDPGYHFINLQVIWAIGICFVLLSGIIYLPWKWILGLGFIIVFGHNMLDTFNAPMNEFSQIPWYVFHQMGFVMIGEDRLINFVYPVVPWIGIMMLGYSLGRLYLDGVEVNKRRKILLGLGLIFTILFFILRATSGYGDGNIWEDIRSQGSSFLAFFKLTKYPPSLQFLLITLGPGLLLLAFIDKVRLGNKNPLLVFGRVPLFFYILHVFLIHLIAVLLLGLSGQDMSLMIIDFNKLANNAFADYGYSLAVVYVLWVFINLMLYPVCYRYMMYKRENRDKKWLRYL